MNETQTSYLSPLSFLLDLRLLCDPDVGGLQMSDVRYEGRGIP